MIVTEFNSRVPLLIRTCGPMTAERADFDVVVDFRGRVDRCGISNAGCHHVSSPIAARDLAKMSSCRALLHSRTRLVHAAKLADCYVH